MSRITSWRPGCWRAPRPAPPAPAPCGIDEATGTLSLDLGNSLATDVAGGALTDAGVLQVVAQPLLGDAVALAATSAGQPFYDRFHKESGPAYSARS